MKTETEIAKENVRIYQSVRDLDLSTVQDKWNICNTHKASCQRFLEFLGEEMKRWETINELSEAYISTGELEEKIQDLKNAIKKYDGAGI